MQSMGGKALALEYLGPSRISHAEENRTRPWD